MAETDKIVDVMRDGQTEKRLVTMQTAWWAEHYPGTQGLHCAHGSRLSSECTWCKRKFQHG